MLFPFSEEVRGDRDRVKKCVSNSAQYSNCIFVQNADIGFTGGAKNVKMRIDCGGLSVIICAPM